MHTTGAPKPKAWEFVSVFPENEKGTYGRRIAESKWQSQTQSPPTPQASTNPRRKPPAPSRSPPRSPNTNRRRPISSPEVATRATYQPSPATRHTVGSQQPPYYYQQHTVHKNVPVPTQDNRNVYAEMRVEGPPSPPTYRSAPTLYYPTDNSMSSSVVGSKPSSSASHICPVSSSDPKVQQFAFRDARQNGFSYLHPY